MNAQRLLPFLVAIALLTSCRKDELFTDDSGATLGFSQSEVLFDTIFTQLAFSVTKSFRVYNNNDGAVRVDIVLEGGAPSPFRINVDGVSGTNFDDVEILAGDSIYVFVEATLDQTGQNTPLIHEDHVVFYTNGNEQKVKLIAWGQDAHYFYPDVFPNGLPAYSIIAGGTGPGGECIAELVNWPDDKPYVIYGYAVVDSCATLTIDPGVDVYVHGGGGLWIYRWGRIEAVGTPDQPITFQSDRLEALYDNLPGQWERIWINDGPQGQDNVFTNVHIKNALVGIQCEMWPGLPDEPTSEARLMLDNVSIRNCSVAGILSRNYRIDASDLLVGDCGQFSLALTGGGAYKFRYLTVANYWNYGVRNDPAFIMTNTYQNLLTGTTQVRDIDTSSFENCIVYGANENEFLLQFDALATPDLEFRRFMVRAEEQSTSNPPEFFPGPILRNQDPGFVSITDRDFHLGPNSNARGQGSNPLLNAGLDDLDGNERFNAYDLGCFDYGD